MELRLEVRTKATTELLGRIPSRLNIEIHDAMKKFAQLHIRNMGQRMRRGVSSGFGQQTKGVTGGLERSFGYVTNRTAGTIGSLQTRIFSAGRSYANIQEHGGVIRPKTRKFLAIPQDAVKTPAGVPRYASPRNYPGKTFVMRDHRGRLWIVESRRTKSDAGFHGPLPEGRGKRKEELTFLWQLVKKVTLRGNLGWFKQWRGDVQERRAILNAAAKRAVDAAVQK